MKYMNDPGDLQKSRGSCMITVVNSEKLSNISCYNCGFEFSDNTMSFLLCGSTSARCDCGTKNTIDNVAVGFISGAEQRSTEDGAKSHDWFHATTVDNWFEKATELNLDVHIGQQGAAFDRLRQVNELVENYDEFTVMNLWTVRVSRVAKIHRELQNDVEDSWDSTKGVSSIYMNRWESPGSVSLYVPASVLSVVSHRLVTQKELDSTNSLFSHEPKHGVLI